MRGDAVFSRRGQYRYTLWRDWSDLFTAQKRYVQFIGLNPSTATAQADDPTIRRCWRFAQAWGFDAMCMTNLFAFRSTDPVGMKQQADPVGPDNDEWIARIALDASLVVAAWGNDGAHLGRSAHVVGLLSGANLHCLSVTNTGEPGHPLYLAKSTLPQPFSGAGMNKARSL
jgi:hypothetical protein